MYIERLLLTSAYQVQDVHALCNGGKQFTGTLHLIQHHIVYVNKPVHLGHDEQQPTKSKENWMTYHAILKCLFRPTPPGSPQRSSIKLTLRDFTLITFNFVDPEQARLVFETFRALTCRLRRMDRLYAFSYRGTPIENKVNGWEVYKPQDEFKRQGVHHKAPDHGWRITHINADYEFSPTYPAVLYVPSAISDNVLKHAAGFRSKLRIPALTYLHPVNNCSITRCAQPMTGINFVRTSRNAQDERLVEACFSAGTKASSSTGSNTPDITISPSTSQVNLSDSADSAKMREQDRLAQHEDSMIESVEEVSPNQPTVYGAQQRNLIVDARPAVNAYANQINGSGSENMDHYPFATRIYLGIDNIHAMRSALNKVIEAIKDGDLTSLPPNGELLAKSKWIQYITGILDGSALIARQVGIHHSHVMIHCSDGWDRTSQLSALAQLMLDPYYRTLEGFMVLVEKDWLSFGHMFGLRTGFLAHENWFKTETDALGGASLPADKDGAEAPPARNEAFESALKKAGRFFSKRPSSTDEVDSDGEPIEKEDVSTSSASSWKPVKGSPEEAESTREKETSPVFHQFLDCVHQLLVQHPTRFEFNDRFLRRLFYHLHSCQYGTFLWNSEKARMEAKAKERTKSVWNYFLADKNKWLNKEYDGEVDDNVRGKERMIFPQLDKVRWWNELFHRTDEEMNGAGGLVPGQVKVPVSTGANTPREYGVLAEVETKDVDVIAEGKSPESVDRGVKLSREPAVEATRTELNAANAAAFLGFQDGIASMSVSDGSRSRRKSPGWR